MKKQLLLLLACLLTSTHAFANDWCYGNCCDCFGFESVLVFDVGGGYRNDSLKWKRYSDATPSVITQERWKNIGMGIVEANANFLACEHYLFKADFDYGWFNRSGHQTFGIGETDLSDELELIKSRTSGNVYNLSGGLGYQFNFDCYRVTLAPMVGWSYNYQKYKNNRYNNFDEDDVSVLIDPSVDFHNKYTYRWNGPWVGAAFAYQPCCDVLLFFDYEFHWAWMHGRVNEHFLLGESDASIRVSQTYGNEFIVGADYLFCDGWFIGAKFDYKNYWGNKGKYHFDGGEDSERVRKLTWVSYNITIDIGYKF